ncbi:MAG: histidinol dehydrogenase [Candidatus Rokubacteria bacterium 13_1_40CM_69_27]|nr:MAG: histidinol dehydrogenase [Candidatus Rokubacteria bacterium 13_1_40CM_69_27]
MIRTLDARSLGVERVASALARPPARVAPEIQRAVEGIVDAVRERGDAELLELTARFDGFSAPAAAALAIPRGEFEAAERALSSAARAALVYAAERIERYHAAALPKSWRVTDEHGSVLGQEVRPIERVGIYVPGGRAAYPSTVLMTAVPARVAGVPEIVLATPPGPEGRVNETVLAAARIAGVTEGYRIGGAQAIAALAYGTATIRRVDKIVGPGNIYVALAKSRVFGEVGIDMVAGPSEVVVVADGGADPEEVAADLLAQAEHDPMARAVLITDASDLLPRIGVALERQLARLPRRAIAAEALAANGALVVVASLDQAVELANRLAPEHLELLVRVPQALLPRVRHAGAVFVGGQTPEVVGDYVAGPSHVLPTAGTARFSSPLGAEDFVKRSSIIEYSRAGLAAALPHLRTLTDIEGLGGHRAAAEVRAKGDTA